jgi:hypothetical protein
MYRQCATIFAAISASILICFGSCTHNDEVIARPSFEHICDVDVPNMSVSSGDVRCAPTWNEKDYGIELVGASAEVSMLSKSNDSSETCLLFEMIAKVETGVKLSFEIDFFDDGYVEYSKTISETDWQTVQYPVTKPSDYYPEDFRIILRKDGKGKTVLARLKQVPGSGCTPTTYKAPLAWTCESGDDCVSGKCGPGRAITRTGEKFLCGQCHDDADCDQGSICGLFVYRSDSSSPELRSGIDLFPYDRSSVPLWTATRRSYYPKCIELSSVQVREVCVRDEECASGFCDDYTDGLFVSHCSQCRRDDDCAPDKVCGLDVTGAALCVNPGLDAFAAKCRSDRECAEGLKCSGNENVGGNCLECTVENSTCPEGAVCNDLGECIRPNSIQIGETCRVDDECESGICWYAVEDSGVCFECASDDDCPPGRQCANYDSPVNGVRYQKCLPK